MRGKLVDFERFIQNSAGRSVKEKIRQIPCLAVVVSVLAAVLPPVLLPEIPVLHMALPVLLVLAVWFLLGTRTAFFLAALPALAGMAGVFFQVNFRQKDPLSDLLHSRMTAAVQAKIRICDPSLYDDGTPSPSYRRVLCRVTAVRFGTEDSWFRTASDVIGVFAPKTKGLSYGREYFVDGVLQRPDEPLWPESFDYGSYLRRRGIHFTLQVNRLEKTGERPSFTGILIGLRNRLLNTLLAGMRTPEERTLAAGMLFGCRQEIRRETREEFIQSGTVHILTVSGLHIGMFAGAVFMLLLAVPFRLRMILTPLLTLLYALSTGMQMPALRAVLMLFCWCVPRALLLRGSALNSVLLAGALLLIWNPFQLKDAGFQYSFLCVITLLASAGHISEWLHLTEEKQHWIPDKKLPKWKRKLTQYLIGAASGAAGCLTAWLCSFVLTAYHQGLALSFAMAANLLIIPVVYVVFVIFTAAALPCLLFPVFGKFLAAVLAVPLDCIQGVCHFFAVFSDGRIPVPPVWSVFFGIAAVWLLFGSSGKKSMLAGLGLVTALLFFWCSGLFRDASPELLLIHGGRQKVPALVLSVPEDEFAVAANLSDYRTAAAAADYLKRRGHADLRLLASSGSGRDFTYGAGYMPNWIKVRHYLGVKPSARSTAARKAAKKIEENGGMLHWQRGKHLNWSSGGEKFETFSENGQFSFDIWKNEHKVHIRMIRDDCSGMEVKVSIPGRKEYSLHLGGDSVPGVVRIKLNW